MLVVDESLSITPDNMWVLKDFVVSFVRAQRVSVTETNIGLIRFSTTSRTHIDVRVNQITDGEVLANFVNGLDFTSNRGNETHHLEAMMLAVKDLEENGRPNAQNVIILLTDGLPEPLTQSARSFAEMTRRNGTSIYGVHLGVLAGFEEVQAVADPERSFGIANFQGLNAILNNLLETNCTG